MSKWKRGDLVGLDGLLAVVVGIEGDPNVPEHHIAVWFGDPRCTRKSEGGKGGERPEVVDSAIRLLLGRIRAYIEALGSSVVLGRQICYSSSSSI